MMHQRFSLPPTGLVLLSIVSTQFGSALAKSLFQVLSPVGVVLLRVGFAAILLSVLWRSQIKETFFANFRLLIWFGLSLALMNLSFYLAIERVPIGIAVTLEFVGPLAVAIANSRQWIDGLWVVLAAIGILLLAPFRSLVFDPIGLGFALLAGGCWAVYILLSKRVGHAIAGGVGLAVAMAIAAVALLPIGIWAEGRALFNPFTLLVGLAVALLSSAMPYSLELEALRRMPVHTFGVLLSLEPVAAALLGFLILGEALDLRAIMAILFVTTAAVGASRFAVRA
jgi:inner membrane transporter RhtA